MFRQLAAALGIAAALGLSATAHAQCADPNLSDGVRTRAGCLSLTLLGARPAPGGTLIVMIHGNNPPGTPVTTTPAWGPMLASMASGATVAVLLRPGYTDGTRRSEGSDMGGVDNWTTANLDAVAEAIQAMKARFRPARTVLFGHSVGGAHVASLIGRNPGIADRAFLLACACDNTLSGQTARRSFNPMEAAPRVPNTTRVLALTGDADRITLPSSASGYVNALRGRGVDATFETVGGMGHVPNPSQLGPILQRVAAFAR